MMANLRLSSTVLAAALVAVGCSVALPAMAQVGIQFGTGGGGGVHQRNSIFNNQRRSSAPPIIIEPGYRQQQEISDMKRCEQAYGQQAVEACTTAVLRDRDNAKAHRLLADALLATGRPGDALNEYNEALRLDSDNDEAKRGREMAQRYLAGNQTPQGQPNTSAAALNPYGANQAPVPAPAPAPQPVAAPTATAAGPRDGEWSGRMLRQCTGFSDEGPASVTVAGTQFSGVFFSSGGGRDLRGSIAANGTVEASGKDTAGTLVEVKGRLLSPQTMMAEGYALNCKMTLLLGRGGAPVSAPSAMAAAQAPTPRTASGNPFDGEWSGTLTPRGGHFVVTATVVDGKLTIKQERQGNRIAAQGAVDTSGQTTLSGSAGDAATRGDNMEIKGTFAGNMFVGQGRVGDRWAEMKLTRTGAPPPPAATVVAQAPAPQPQAPAPAAQTVAQAPKPVEAVPTKVAEAPKPEPTVAAAPPAPAKPAPAPKTQTAAVPPAATTVAPSPAPMVDKQAPTIAVPAKLDTDGPVVELTGKIADTSSIIEFSINGQPVPVGAGGSFTVRRGVPVGASELKLAAVDEWGNMAQKTIAVNRKAAPAVAAVAPAPAASPVNAESPKAVEAVKVVSVAEQLKSIEFGSYRALVIGNNNYTKVRPLETALNDARVVADLLTKEYGFQVTVLTDATRQQIMEALYRMRAQLGEGDNLLVYYAGHGVRDDQTGRGYWLPVDADPDLPTNWIPTTDLTDVIKGMRARHIMVVADSCYSGTLVRSVNAGMRTGREDDISAWVKRIVTKRSRTVMSSGGLEPVMDGGGGNHSVFAKAFIDALRENPDVLDGQGLFASIRRPVVLNSDQTPEYADIRQAGHDGGDFLFVKKPR